MGRRFFYIQFLEENNEEYATIILPFQTARFNAISDRRWEMSLVSAYF
jgi:hypothetical protein